MTSGLRGIRVVDIGRGIAGPMVGTLLADAGADVVRIDAPDSPPRGAQNRAFDGFVHRGKRRVTLDLRVAHDWHMAHELMVGADVVVENFRPGALATHGLGGADLLMANPRLVHCALPGFAPDDEHASRRATEGVLHAATAGFRPLNEHWDPSGRTRVTVEDPAAPLFTPVTTASNFGAFLGATLVVAALLARERTGRGQLVEIPLAEAMNEAYSTMLGWRVYSGRKVPDNLMLADTSYRCADGGMIDLSPYPKFVIRVLTAAGVADDWQARGLIDVATSSFTLAERPRIQDEFAALVASRPAHEWEQIGLQLLTPLAEVRTPGEWLLTEHARQSGAVVTLDDPDLGPLVMPGRAVDLEGVDWPLRPAHRLDADRGDLARTAPAPAARSGADIDIDRALDGVRIVDMTQAVAGPTASRLLADLGASVVKVASPTPAVTDGIVGHLHRGKQTIVLDTRSDEGHAVLARLVARADALITNFTATAAAKYRMDADRLWSINPDLVYCSISAFGARGPWASRRAYENQCNAATGMSSDYGRRFGWTLYQPSPINDAATGILAAFATLVGVYARTQGAPGHVVATSLAQASTWHQACNLVRPAGAVMVEDETRSEHGPNALRRRYRALDRWFFLDAMPADRDVFARLGLHVDGDTWASWREPQGPLAAALAAAFAVDDADHWEEQFAAVDVGALTIATIDEAAAYLSRRGAVYYERGLEGARVPRPGIGPWMSATPPRPGPQPGPVGSQAVEVLRDLGYDDDEIDELAARRAVRLPDDLPNVTLRT
jgi:crotonobetainyl-CoA:carnitine CoA-transferase CaiB-like acyl-CoA transferase